MNMVIEQVPIVHQCENCGAYNVTSQDGMKCGQCGIGILIPKGKAIMLDREDERRRLRDTIHISVELDNFDNVKEQLEELGRIAEKAKLLASR